MMGRETNSWAIVWTIWSNPEYLQNWMGYYPHILKSSITGGSNISESIPIFLLYPVTPPWLAGWFHTSFLMNSASMASMAMFQLEVSRLEEARLGPDAEASDAQIPGNTRRAWN
jgi:hypothetical protein